MNHLKPWRGSTSFLELIRRGPEGEQEYHGTRRKKTNLSSESLRGLWEWVNLITGCLGERTKGRERANTLVPLSSTPECCSLSYLLEPRFSPLSV